jgi:DNA repair exonuclease SbcCD nuclease subunit
MGPLNRVIEFFHRLSQMCEHLYLLVGNHDRSNTQIWLEESSPFTACKHWPNVTVVDKVKTDETNHLVFVPYVPNGRFMEALSTRDITPENINTYKLIFAHQEFRGCKMGAIVSVNGDEYDPSYPLCISGHIHDYQIPQNNIIYPGTPIQLGYGVPPSKGVMIVNLADDITYEFIDLGLPRKTIIHVTPSELANFKLPENTYVKLVCKGDASEIREITKLESVKELLKNPKIKLSIKEDRKSKKDLPEIIQKTETMAFQKRLVNAIESQPSDIRDVFMQIFGELKVNE